MPKGELLSLSVTELVKLLRPWRASFLQQRRALQLGCAAFDEVYGASAGSISWILGSDGLEVDQLIAGACLKYASSAVYLGNDRDLFPIAFGHPLLLARYVSGLRGEISVVAADEVAARREGNSPAVHLAGPGAQPQGRVQTTDADPQVRG